MNPNTRYLLSLWLFAVPALVFLIFVLVVSLWNGNVIPIVAVVALLIVAKLLTGDRRIGRLLQSNTSADLVAHFKRTLRPGTMPDVDAWAAHSCAVAQIIYGDFDEARKNLQAIHWEQRPPLIQASGKCVETLLCYFETLQFERGLELARTAQQLGMIAGVFPGSKTSAAAFGSYVDVGDVLCHRSTPSTIADLEAKMKLLPLLGRLLVAYGLSLAYWQAGDSAKAATMQTFIRKTAPHCKVLLPTLVT